MSTTQIGSSTYGHADHYVICDICGFQYRRSECKKNHHGQIVCAKDFETRHPQEMIRAVQDKIGVKDARPVPDYLFVGPLDVTVDDL